ncbi:MAG: hypothetical protein HYX65_03205 [Gemmatimonadetes bacterium]|nr:hypothetical protein [Gemmatimonadota bacterium]
MAVDVEPTVFWSGDKSEFSARLQEWCRKVAFRVGDEQGQDGTIARTSPSTNGSSGKKVEERYLRPIGLKPERTSFTDIFPVFMVKKTRRQSMKRREQGDAIAQEYDVIAAALGRSPCTLPERIPDKVLPTVAAEHFAERLVDDILAAKPPLIISLGDEVWRALRNWPHIRANHNAESFDLLRAPRYGERGSIEVDGHRAEWLPLVHPGLLKNPAPMQDSWESQHLGWEQNAGKV